MELRSLWQRILITNSLPPLLRNTCVTGQVPGGLQALILGAKIRAILDSRYHVARDDLKTMALPVLRHRMILNFEGQAEESARMM
jgi:MoxR-like ATPase